MEERETRFTLDVLTEASERLNAVKERHHVAGNRDVDDLLSELSFAPLAAHEVVLDVVETFQETDLDEKARMAMAAWELLMLGAIAADISWERSFGLSETTCS